MLRKLYLWKEFTEDFLEELAPKLNFKEKQILILAPILCDPM